MSLFSGRWPIFALLCLVCLAGCSSKETPTEANQAMYIEVHFNDMHRCSRISPEIAVYNPPRGTAYYEVRVSPIGDSPERSLGSSRWPYGGVNEDGADIIPEGGLANVYRAPCLAPGQGFKSFRYTVYARSKTSAVPLAISAATVTLE